MASIYNPLTNLDTLLLKHWYPSQSFHFLLISQAGSPLTLSTVQQLSFPTEATKSCWFADTYTQYLQSRNILKKNSHVICYKEVKQFQ